jgi:hypothetical protein
VAPIILYYTSGREDGTKEGIRTVRDMPVVVPTNAANAWAATVCSSLSLVLLIAAASTCRFVTVQADRGSALEALSGDGAGDAAGDVNGTITSAVNATSIGVYCSGDYYDLSDDSMWLLTRTFVSFAVIFSATATTLSWAVSVCVKPRHVYWQMISVASALSALVSIPVFLLFETEPCSALPTQTCQFSTGAFLLVLSLVLALSTTIITQCLDQPADITKFDNVRSVFERKKNPPAHDGVVRIRAEVTQPSVPNRWSRQLNSREGSEAEEPCLKSPEDTVVEEIEGGLIGEEAKQLDVADAALLENLKGVDQTHEEEESDGPDLVERGLRHLQAVMGAASNSALADALADESVLDSEHSTDGSNPSSSFGLETVPEVDSVTTAAESGEVDGNGDSHASAETELDHIKVDSENMDMGAEGDSTGLDPDGSLEKALVVDLTSDSEKFDSYDKDDLGSLEPTVMEITGEESILDRSEDVHIYPMDDELKARTAADEDSDISSLKAQEKPLLVSEHGNEPNEEKTSKKIGETMQKVMLSPVDLGLAVLSKARMNRKKRGHKRYRLMDDSDLESSLPISPPLEILTLSISHDTDFDFDPHDSNQQQSPIGEAEEDEDWTMENKAISPVKVSQDETDPYDVINDCISFDSLGSPEEIAPPSMTTIDGGYGLPSRGISMPRQKRSGNKGVFYPSRSVASVGSVLTQTIAEETAEDLESSESSVTDIRKTTVGPYGVLSPTKPAPLIRTRSAPNLAKFGRMKHHAGVVAEEIKMSGMNSYHTAKIYRESGSSSRGRSREIRSRRSNDSKTDSRSQPPLPSQKRDLIGEAINDTRNDTASLVTPKKEPIFRQERLLRCGIHRGTSNVSGTSSSDEGNSVKSMQSLTSKKARVARIRRLQMQSHLPIATHSSPDIVLSTGNDDAGSDRTPTRRINSTSRSPGQLSSGSSGASANKSLDSGYSSGGYYIDLLDVQLAELGREEGSLKGPEEGSC